jgi:protein-tyrosine phosphatase
MLEAFSDIRWLGERNSVHEWEMQQRENTSATVDPDKLTVRLEGSATPLKQVPGHPLRVATPTDMRGGSFIVEYDQHKYPLISRQIPLEGTSNCRDLGGYVGAGQKTVRWRKLLRSSHWSDLSDDDLRYLHGLNIALICDFRSEAEQKRQPPKLPKDSDISLVPVPITPGSASSFYEQFTDRLNKGTEDDAHQIMRQVNRELVLGHSAKYQRMFELILDNNRGAVVINCTAGKDRTGLGAILILLALGVAEDVAVQDYLKTRDFNAQARKRWANHALENHGLSEVLIKSMLTVRKDYIDSALEAMREAHGGIDNYLTHLGMNGAARDELQARFLV